MNLTLEGDEVALIPLSRSQVPELLRYSREPSLWEWWLRPPPIDETTLGAEIDLALRLRDAGTRIPWAIFHRARGECIGSTSLFYVDPENRTAEIGSTWLGLPFLRTGINRACKRLLLGHAFEGLGLNRITLQTDELNVRSRRAIEGLGARFEGIRREDRVVWDGRIRSTAVYSILRREWRPE